MFNIAAQEKVCFWANCARIRRLYNKDQEDIQQGSEGYTTRIRGLYHKDQKVMFSEAFIELLQKTFAYKGCKINAQFFLVFFCEFSLTSRIFFVLLLLSASVERCFVSRMRDFYYDNMFPSAILCILSFIQNYCFPPQSYLRNLVHSKTQCFPVETMECSFRRPPSFVYRKEPLLDRKC